MYTYEVSPVFTMYGPHRIAYGLQIDISIT